MPTALSAVEASVEPLSAFTNRLSPLIAGPRVLVNLTLEAEAPPVDDEPLISEPDGDES